MPSPSPTRQALIVWPLFLAVALLMLGNGLQGSLLGLRATLEGFSTAATGAVMSGYYAGFLVGSVGVPKLVGGVGHVRVYAGLASLASAATLAHLIVTEPVAWFLFRAITGTCLAGLYIVAESWLNGASRDATRGRILAIYMVVVTGGLAVGQMLLTVADPGGFLLFLLASILVSMAVVPVALVRFPAPAIPAPDPIPYRLILHTAPIGLIGALITGAANGAVLGMGAVWGAAEGLSVDRIAVLLTLALVGGVVLQWPLGALSDLVSRRRVIFAVTVAAALAAAGLAMLDAGQGWALVVMLLLGGFSFPMYSLSGSHVNDLMGAEHAVGASSAIMLANGIGAVAGPFGASVVMTAAGPSGLWMFVAAVHGVLGVYAGWRIIRRWNIPAPGKRPYLPYPARSGGLRWLARR
ncbi:MAG TPA: MFS transporter [Acidimicrobiia bacterium]|nr:MFS transporter [Acidimicrobiia bacterium]